MLCDVAANFFSTTENGAQNVTALRVARRYFLQPNFTSTADELADEAAVERSRPYLILPDTMLWLEWRAEGFPNGLLLEADAGSVTRADGYRVSGAPRRPFAEPVIFDATAPAPQMLTPHPVAHPARWDDYERLSLWLAAALALLNTPRLLTQRTEQPDRLNAKRERSGKPALLSYTEVHVNIDRPSESGGARNGEGMALHRVRAHPRLSRGRVQIVRACWRGNPRHGVKLHHYIVKRDEDNDLDAADLVKPPCMPERRVLGDTLPAELAGDPSLQAHLDRLEARNG